MHSGSDVGSGTYVSIENCDLLQTTDPRHLQYAGKRSPRGKSTFSTATCDVGRWRDIVAIAAGAAHTVGLRTDGGVVATGSNSHGQLEVGAWSLA